MTRASWALRGYQPGPLHTTCSWSCHAPCTGGAWVLEITMPGHELEVVHACSSLCVLYALYCAGVIDDYERSDERRAAVEWARLALPEVERQARAPMWLLVNPERALCPDHAAGKPFHVVCAACAPCHSDVLGRAWLELIP